MTENREGLAFRNPVKQEGWAMIYHVLTLDRDLTDGAFRLYVLLLKYARQAEQCWPGRERLSKDLGKSVRTIDYRLDELVERGLITREQRLNTTAMTWIEDVEDAYRSVPAKNCMDVPAKNCRGMSLQKIATKEETEKETDMKDGGGHTKEQKQVVELLSDFGVSQAVATRLAAQRSLEDVRGWLAYAKAADGLQDPVAFVVARLRDGEVPPDNGKATEEDDRRRYLEWLQ